MSYKSPQAFRDPSTIVKRSLVTSDTVTFHFNQWTFFVIVQWETGTHWSLMNVSSLRLFETRGLKTFMISQARYYVPDITGILSFT